MNDTTTPAPTATPKAHPFELAGMGRGPYRFAGFAQIPSAHLAENNPSAYNAALAMLPKDLRGGCGTCQNCGMAISNIYIVADADGARYGVGCDCVEKTGDVCLSKPVLIAKNKMEREARRQKADAKRREKHAKWMLAICPTGETNAERIIRENRQREDGLATFHAACDARMESFADVVAALPEGNDFFASLIFQLSHRSLTDRQAWCIAEQILGRRGAASTEGETLVARLTAPVA